MKLLRAESEGEVNDIIASDPRMSDAKNWHPLDNRESNFNVVTNQASTGSKALTELCTNMVDALLMKYALLKGYPLTGPRAPSSVLDAVRLLIPIRGLRKGRLSDVDSERYLREFAQDNLWIAVQGGTQNNSPLCFTFVDNGEGQHPAEFERTFLSLSTVNKSQIPFVQGKFNMGSSGVLKYCGNNWYKLIVSRRFDQTGDWGWTLLRRRATNDMPVAEYLLFEGSIPDFGAASLQPLMTPSGENDPLIDLASGTVIRLYDYYFGKTVDFLGIREGLNENLISTVLPFRLMDYRYPARRSGGGRRRIGVDERPFYGMEWMLLRHIRNAASDDRESNRTHADYDEVTIADITDRRLGTISIRGILLPRELPAWLKPSRSRNRVFHSVNGQVQLKQNRAFLSSECGLAGLKDRIVIIVDSSDLNDQAHWTVWKGDRESVQETALGRHYLDTVTTAIKSSELLKHIERTIGREEIERIAGGARKALFEELVKSDPSLASLFNLGSLFNVPKVGHIPEEYKGRYSPTFLRLKAARIRTMGLDVEALSERRVELETDVANDYLRRAPERGVILYTATSRGEGRGIENPFAIRAHLHNGLLTLRLKAIPGELKVGDSVSLIVTLSDDAILEPVAETLTVNIVAERAKQKPGQPGQRKGSGDESNQQLQPPPTVWLTRDGRMIEDPDNPETRPWDVDHDDFGESDGGYAKDLGEDVQYFINYDNIHLQNAHRGLSATDKRVLTEKFRLSMLLVMLSLEDALREAGEASNGSRLEEYIDDVRRTVPRAASTIVLALTTALPEIINPLSIRDADDD